VSLTRVASGKVDKGSEGEFEHHGWTASHEGDVFFVLLPHSLHAVVEN
jgi:hypothetical protein